MKKYFTKYLPVEGEIKEGDMTASKPDGAVVKVKTEGFAEVSNRLGGLKMKLFLCSRDIQVDDRVDTIRDTRGIVALINDKGVFVKIDDFDYSSYVDKHHHYKKESVYKVIGEISPEANFVKEGDEFSDGEFCYRQFGNGRIYLERPEWFNYIAIKCPCCGDFK